MGVFGQWEERKVHTKSPTWNRTATPCRPTCSFISLILINSKMISYTATRLIIKTFYLYHNWNTFMLLRLNQNYQTQTARHVKCRKATTARYDGSSTFTPLNVTTTWNIRFRLDFALRFLFRLTLYLCHLESATVCLNTMGIEEETDRTLFIRNLDPRVTEELLFELFLQVLVLLTLAVANLIFDNTVLTNRTRFRDGIV